MTRIDRLMLLVPNTRWFGKRHFQLSAYTPCLLAAILGNMVDVNIVDANMEDLDFDQVRKRLQSYSPQMVGITSLSVEYAKAAHKMAELTKSSDSDIITVMGGIYPTLLPHLAMKSADVDFVVIGEGEIRFRQLIEQVRSENKFFDIDGICFRKDGETIIQPKVSYIQNLDEIPFPDYAKVEHEKYFMMDNKGSVANRPRSYPYADTISSRGCPFHCIFCSSQAINGPNIRYRSACNVLEEIDLLVTKYDIRHITFNDDNFLLDKKRVKEIMRGLIERDYGISWKTPNAAVYALDEELLDLMKESGGYQVFLAIESGNQDVLKNIVGKPLRLDKVPKIVNKCKEIGLQTGGMFVIGLPGESWDQIRETIKFAEDLDLDYTMINIATPLPCTPMLEIAKAKGYLDKNVDFDSLEFCGFGQGVITTEEFEPFELQVLRAFEWDRLNFSSSHKKTIIADMLGISLEEIEILRKNTRKNLGVGATFTKEA